MCNNKYKLLLLSCLLVLSTLGWSLVADYNFTDAIGTYGAISGGTVHGTSANNDQVFNAIPIGFVFNYNQQDYSAISISSNGYIAMGSTVANSNTPLSTGVTNNVIAALTRDIISRSDGELMSLLSGETPNQIFTVQWKNYRRNNAQATGDTLNFQIQLHESGNKVLFSYGYFKAVNYTGAITFQCGLRGATNADFFNRTTTTSWTATTAGLTNTATCVMNNTIVPPNGLAFSWIPPGIDPPSPAGIVFPLNNAIRIRTDALLKWISTGGGPTGYKVYLGTDNPPTNLVNGTTVTALTYDHSSDFNYSTVYYWKIVPFNSNGDALDCPTWSFTTMANPLVTTYPYSERWDLDPVPTVSPAWTVVDANNDGYTWVSLNTGAYSTPNTMRCINNSTVAIPMDDWLISPPCVMVADSTYQISFRFKAHNSAFTEKLEVLYGVSNTPAALTNLLYTNVSVVNTGYIQESAFITPTITGTYYFGFHGFSNANMYALYIDDVDVNKIVPVFNPPRNLTASTGSGTVVLNWLPPETRRLDGYLVYRDSVQITPNPIFETGFVDNQVSLGIEYDYYVTAAYVSPNGMSEGSNAVSIIPAFNPPLNLQGTATTTTVSLTWQPPTGSLPVGYLVYKNGVSITPALVTNLMYQDNTGVIGQVYAYHVTAIYSNPEGESDPSNVVNIGPQLPPVPPTELTATVVSPNVILNWIPPIMPSPVQGSRNDRDRDLIGFKIYRNAVLIGSVNDAGQSTYTDQNLMPGTYSYTVSSLYTSVESVQTEPVSATVLPVFNPPTNVTATGGLTSIVVTWSPPSPILGNLTGYRLFRDGSLYIPNLLTQTTFVDSTILSGRVYEYFVRAFYTNPTGVSAPSVSAFASGGENLVPVSNLQGVLVYDDVTLTWTPPGGPILEDWIRYDDSANFTGIGTDAVANFDIAARFTQTELSGIQERYLTKVRFFPKELNCIYTVKIYTGGTALAIPGNLVDTVRVMSPVIDAWNTVNLHAPIPIPSNGELRIAININTQTGYPAGCDNGPSIPYKGNVMFSGGEWIILTQANPDFDYNWNIQGFVVNYLGQEALLSLSDTIIPEQPVNTGSQTFFAAQTAPVTNPAANRDETRLVNGYKVYRNGTLIHTVTDYHITSHTDYDLPNGIYEYEVTATYATGESEPCDSVIILINNPVMLIAVDESFETYDNFALSFGDWILNDVDGSTTVGIQGVTFENSGSPMAYTIFNPSATTPPITNLTPHTGTKMAASFAANTPPNNDWLISPRVKIGTQNNSISFWVKSYTAQYGLEKFKVGISQATNPLPTTFTNILSGPTPIEAPVEWTKREFNIPVQYNGLNVRFGIKCESNDAFIFFVDDVIIKGVGIDNEDEVVPITTTSLGGNYPNPFNPETSISYFMKNDGKVSIDIYNIKGEKVKTLFNGRSKAGSHQVKWTGIDDNGKSVSSGVYFYRMKSGTYTSTKKMILMK